MIRIQELLLMCLFAGSSASSTCGQYIYWREAGDAADRINRCRLDGSECVAIIEDTSISCFIMDPGNDHIYWGRGAVPTGSIVRSDLDGSNVVELAASGSTTSDIVLDHLHGKMYWTDFAQGKIHRANLNGSNVELLDTVGLHVNGIDLDVGAGRMYYTLTAAGIVRRADLDAQNVETLVGTAGVAHDIDLDIAGGTMYFVAAGVQRANLDGSNVETLFDIGASGLALDRSTGHVYWSSRIEGKIKRGRIDGTNAEDLIVGLTNPFEIAVLTAPGDLDGDGEVGLADYTIFSLCLNGVSQPPASSCPVGVDADFDDNGTVDLADFAVFSRLFAG